MKKTILALSVLLFLTNQYQSFGQTLGEQCNPEKGSNRPGITCQATDEWLYTQPYIQNAKKGDVIVSAVDGMISGLLRNVNPPQKFSHSGIMVSNYSTIRHSTAVPERTRRNAGSDGFDINLLKYGWPGTLTETIDDAYEGQYHVDPEGFSYFIKSFNLDPVNYPGDTAVIFPSVVKPPIDFEANPAFDVRSKLELIADEAENIEGHYRFFAYTDGSIVGNLLFTASAEAPWAFFDAQNGTVCSELIWNAANRAKLTRPDLEIEDPIIEPTDRSHPSSPAKRGLFIYSEGERRAAGDWLYNEVYNAFYEEAGWFGRLFTDAPDDGANQIVNCFGFDWCGEEAYRHFIPSLTDQTLHSEPTGGSHSKDSDRWKNPGIGVALAPDDIRFNWDLPPTGLYGAAQNIAYRTGRYIRVHRWTRSEGTADVIVNITFEGNPLENAEVKILGFPEELTDSSGQTQFVAIPGGHYVIEASKTIQMDFGIQIDAFGTTEIEVPSEGVITVNLTLTGDPVPSPEATRWHRFVTIQGTIYTEDDETFGSNEKTTIPVDVSVVLEPQNKPNHVFTFRPCTGDEVRTEVTITVSMDPTNFSVLAHCNGKLYEGTSCSTSDFEDEANDNIRVAEEGSEFLRVDLCNGEFAGGDFSRIRLTVTNTRQPSI